MTGMWAADDDHRGEDLVENPRRYFAAARMRAERDVAAGVDRRRAPKPAVLGPGIVEMSLRGAEGDVEALVAKMRAEGIKVWLGDSRGTRGGNAAGYRYFSVEVPPEG